MFSGLTNQVSSWMGAAKGEPQDEEVPTPTKDALGEAAAEGEKQRSLVFCIFSCVLGTKILQSRKTLQIIINITDYYKRIFCINS